jgi:hypothetical protein
MTNPSAEEALSWPTYIKRPNPVHMQRMKGPFEVDTAEGRMSCQDGYLAYDHLTGHMWPVAADYVVLHYDRVSEEVVAP